MYGPPCYTTKHLQEQPGERHRKRELSKDRSSGHSTNESGTHIRHFHRQPLCVESVFQRPGLSNQIGGMAISAAGAVVKAILAQIQAHADMVGLSEHLHVQTVATCPYEGQRHSIYWRWIQQILANDDKVLQVYNGKYPNTLQVAIVVCKVHVADIPIKELLDDSQSSWKNYDAMESDCTA